MTPARPRTALPIPTAPDGGPVNAQDGGRLRVRLEAHLIEPQIHGGLDELGLLERLSAPVVAVSHSAPVSIIFAKHLGQQVQVGYVPNLLPP